MKSSMRSSILNCGQAKQESELENIHPNQKSLVVD